MKIPGNPRRPDDIKWLRADEAREGEPGVEVGLSPSTDCIYLRNAADHKGSWLEYTHEEWRAFCQGAMAGDFDDL